MDKKQTHEDTGFLFNVDILITNSTNALALQALLEMLSGHHQIADFKIKSGMELGQIIDVMLQEKRKSLISKSRLSSSSPAAEVKKIKAKVDIPLKPTLPQAKNDDNRADQGTELNEWIRVYIRDNRLIRLTANRNGQHISMPCRILNFDEDKQLLNVYHVDEKQVYTFSLNEVDEFI
ncbi:hypothetical protein [Paenibacillus pini]|uniref:Uncharacterized protein n=1 Tax=Paenibacillus pini JCM 16418 TaxID=1236976 RepID=W7YFJ5_9BACL|nr:hypothetical protein [Paenibacillus pini]GAF06278.1 hypothetical protein JCM16418_229 [Paenibacillus pini JCM 16418]